MSHEEKLKDFITLWEKHPELHEKILRLLGAPSLDPEATVPPAQIE